MAHTKGESNQGGHQSSEEPYKRGIFSKVKDKLDFTKHLGFQSDPNSLANREALERGRAAREAEEERERNLGPAPPPGASDRDGIGGVVETLAGVVTPKTENTLTPIDKAVPAADPVNKEGEQRPNEAIQFDESPGHSMNGVESNISTAEQADQEQGKDKSKDPDLGWGRWMVHKVHQVQRAAASKDLSDELLKKEPKAKVSK
ncbi:hypothetical protein MPTK1_2g02630 [Marchantia polymorpha subsp. ruderalis]|uniref:Uncharacterized protein n=1 Tax=Marchantia polymorpha TaxID=3197 RepID=A0A2R6WM17_MARPO|nr:hypothetical protein MARPO_0075s0025 [Marchantia polymorpha]BBN00848.1 hypothetical protein Mp_2g02630 [Marchantia polymorpha subsp. ruderalis]|eukprot:PTQ34901.1 hypothetical protein MARPO_0075s0025 [Marchantia polymorpha]